MVKGISNGVPLEDRIYRLEIFEAQALPESKLTSLDTTRGTLDTDATVAKAAAGQVKTDAPLDTDISVGDLAAGKKPDDRAYSLARTFTVAHMNTGNTKLVFNGYYTKDNKPGYRVFWDVSMSIDEHAPTGQITIDNLSDADYAKIQHKDMVQLSAGYRTTGLEPLILGMVVNKSIIGDTPDRTTVLDVAEAKHTWLTTMAWREGEVNDMASTVIKDLLRQMPIPYIYEGVGRDLVYRYGKTFDQTVSVVRALSYLARDTFSKFWVENGRVHWTPIEWGDPLDLRVSSFHPWHNLIGHAAPVMDEQNSPREETRWRVRCLLDGRIKPSSVFFMQARNFAANMRAIQVQYVANEHDYYNNMDAAVHWHPAFEKPLSSGGRMEWLLSQGQERALAESRRHQLITPDDIAEAESGENDPSDDVLDLDYIKLDDLLKQREKEKEQKDKGETGKSEEKTDETALPPPVPPKGGGGEMPQEPQEGGL